ncbi:MAG: hypothetical protein ACOYB3_01720 [Azonexus sp.]
MAMPGSAQSILESFLADYGLEDLASWAWSMYLGSGAASVSEFTPQLKAELPTHPSFQARFPAYQALLDAGRGISIDQYRQYETDIQKAARFYGLPDQFVNDRQYVKDIMVQGVSADEFAERAQIARDNALNAPAEERTALKNLYNVSEGDLTAFWMDPEKAMPLIQRQAAAAQIAGAGLRNNIAIDAAQAERLAAQDVTTKEAASGFQSVAAQQGLTRGDYSTSEADLIAAQFGDAAAAKRVEAARGTRTAQYQGGGGASESQTGVTGLGKTRV